MALTRAIAAAYATIHEAGVGHGDVHPNNILVDSAQNVSLIDFGVGIRFAGDGPKPRAGVAMFTEPEVARAALAGERSPDVTPTSEQYVVAAVLFQMLTGSSHRPQLLNNRDLMKDRAVESPLTFAEIDAELPESFELVLRRALDPDPANRFGSMAHLADALPFLHRSDSQVVPSGALQQFRDDVFRSLDPSNSLYSVGVEAGPRASLAVGTAGIVYALARQAVRTGDIGLAQQAEAWLVSTRGEALGEWAWTNQRGDLDPETVSPASLLHPEAGIEFVECIVAAVLNRPDRLSIAIERLLDRHRSPGGIWDGDLTIGPLGLIPGLAHLRPLLGSTHRDSIDEVARRILESNPLCSDEVNAHSNLGLAHGATGRAYAHLLWELETGERTADWQTHLQQALRFAVPSGRGMNIPWNIDPGSPPSSMPGWCNGAAGIVAALCAAARCGDSDIWLRRAEPFVSCAHESRESGHDICCGTAGRAYAIAEFGVLSGDHRWVARAESLATRTLARVSSADREQHPAHALIKGDLGLALFACDLEHPASLRFPVMGALA